MERRGGGVLSFLRGGRKGENGRGVAAAPPAAAPAAGAVGAQAQGRPRAAGHTNGELTWDPVAAMESWLPPATPALAGGGAVSDRASAGGGSAHGGKLASAWSRLKQRLRRGSPGRRGGFDAAADGHGALLTVGVSPLDDVRPAPAEPCRPSMLHTTGSAPLPPLPQAVHGLGPHPSRIPKPPAAGGTPQPGPRGGSPSGSGYGDSGWHGPAPADPQAAALPLDAGGTARRLEFSPAALPPWAPASSQPIPIAGRPRHSGWAQQGAPAGQHYGSGPSQRRGAAAPPQHGSQRSPAPANRSAAFSASLAGSAPGPGSLPLALGPGQLGMPARSRLAGRWVREAAPPGAGEDGAADVDFLLQIPPLQAAARERTRELQIVESEGELVLEWGTLLSSGARIRRAEALPKSGALAGVPRLDGRAGSAAAQLSASIDGTLAVRALQGPPLPALVEQKLRLSSSGDRLKVTLKVQLLVEQQETAAGAPAGGGAGAGGARHCAAARQVTYWRRVRAG